MTSKPTITPTIRPPPPPLLLDSQIRDWVVLPLLLIMILAGLLRSSISKYLRPSAKPVNVVTSRSKSILVRISRFKGPNGNYISESRWEARRCAWSARGDNATSLGYLRQEAKNAESQSKSNNNEDTPIPGMPMTDPSTMLDGMKGNMAAMVQNMIMMQGISHFFRGYILVKVPFPLTTGFKQMFQRGLDLNNLDTSYVSSVSWYFLVMFGLRAFFRLAMGDARQEEMEGVEIQKGLGLEYSAGGGPPGSNFDGVKVLKGEADNLELMGCRGRRFCVDEAERNLLGKSRYPKKSRRRGVGDNGGGEDVLFGLSAGRNDGNRAKQKAL